MSETVIHPTSAFAGGAAPRQERRKIEDSVALEHGPGQPPIGYRWASKRWRLLPDGTRDYAASHGKSEFWFLLPVSSKLRPPRR